MAASAGFRLWRRGAVSVPPSVPGLKCQHCQFNPSSVPWQGNSQNFFAALPPKGARDTRRALLYKGGRVGQGKGRVGREGTVWEVKGLGKWEVKGLPKSKVKGFAVWEVKGLGKS